MAFRHTLRRLLLLATLAAGGWVSGCGAKGNPGSPSTSGTSTSASSGGTGGVTTSSLSGGGGAVLATCPPDLAQPACSYGEQQPCYQGDPGTEGTGSCHAGKQRCDQNAFGVCEGQGLPAPATCAAPTVFGCGAAPACGAPAFQVVPPPVYDVPSNGRAVVIDPQGNIAAVATTSDPVASVILTKVDPTGNTLWSKTFVSATSLQYSHPETEILGVAAGTDGRLFVAGGVIYGTLSFGGPALGDTGQTGFVVALDPAGDHLWSKGFAVVSGATPVDTLPQVNIAGVTTDSSGNVYLAGSFGIGDTLDPSATITLDLGGGPLDGVAAGTGFVAKLDPSGNHLWSASVGGPLGGSAAAVAVDAAGNVFVTGSSSYATGDVRPGGNGACTYPAMLLASYDVTGAARWSKTFGSTRTGGSGTGIVAGPSGDLFVVGSVGAALDLGGGLLGGSAFAARFDGSGGHVWSMSTETGPADIGLGPAGVGLDGAGNVVAVTSAFRVVKIRPDGVVFTNQTLAVEQVDWNTSLTVAAAVVGPAGNVVFTGRYSGVVDFGLGDTASSHTYDAFVLALDP